MSERRWSNFSSCCRLCLSDKLDTLKSIFEDVTRGREIVKNVKICLGVNVFANDQLSTMICTQCLSKVDSWNDYRKSCRENQSKLIGWMNAWSSSNAGDISIQIKDEVVEDGDGPPPRQVNIDENGVIRIKSEPIAVCSDSEIMDEDAYDMQPAITEPLDFDSENDEEGECDMDQVNAFTLTDGINGLVSDVDPLEVSQNGEGSNCRICNKVFSTPGNRRKHEYVVHKRKDGNFLKSNDNAVEVLDDEQNTWNTDESTTGSSSITGNETEIQKIQFAAGLQLQQRSAQQDENVPLTKVEISYLDKCKTIVKMTETLVCACHGERFNDQKDLFIHLKKMRTWFAMFTCYNCLITFGDRSTYMKHFCSCTKPILENLKRLANTAINPKVKIRLYQSYKCIKCDCIFSFREDYNSHLDEEHLDAAEGPPYACVCSQSFDEIEEYKQHVHVSCFLRYFCDICFGAFTTVEAFRAHCEKEHDTAEGNSLDTYDSYHKGKAPDIIGMSGKRSLPGDSTESDNVIKRRRTINLPLSQVDSEDSDYIETNQLNNPQAFRNMKCSKPTACPLCDKLYSSYHNMLRHYKQAHDETGKLLGCMYCSEKFRLISEVKEHEALVHGIEPNNSETDTNMEQYKFSCPVCGSLFKSLDEWKIHTEQHPKKSCEECGKQFMLQSELDQHRSVHLNIKVYRDAKTKDYKSTMVSPNLICEICDKSFTDKSELQQHKLLHEKMPVLDAHDDGVVDEKKDLSKKYSCEPCNKHYVSYGGIWDHNKKYHSGQPVASTATEYRKQCDECPKILTSKAALINHQRMHDRMNAQQTTPNIKYEEDDEEFGVRNRPKSRGSKTNDDEEESYYTCKRCFKVFSSKYNLRNHMKSHGIILNPSNRSSTKTGKIIKTYWCDICHQACPGYAELQEHKQEHRKENTPNVEEAMEEVERKPLVFCCNICTATFQTNFALRRHKEKHAAEEEEESKAKQVYVYCKYCKIAFQSTEELNDHMCNEHEQQVPKTKPVQKPTGKKFACDVCKKVFDNSGALASHQGWHKRGKFGKKILKSKEKVVRTMLNQTPKSATPTEGVEYQCETCYQQFPNDTALQIHILEKHRDVNTTILSMSCNSCKLTFETKSAYDTHIQLHKAVESQRSPKAHPCKYCPAGFSRSDTLNAHVRQHHKEHYHDVFRCNQCERVFDKQNALTIHLKVHERQRLSGDVGPKPNHNKNIYFCSICDVGFAIAKDLRNHVVSAHPF